MTSKFEEWAAPFMALDVQPDPYWWTESSDLPFFDFNKEIIKPGYDHNWPEGCTGVRVDDDFWAVAALPYEFKRISIRRIVKVLWPDKYLHASFNPTVYAKNENH